jgi:hypothetical protein
MDALFSYGMVLPLYENNSGIGLRTSQPFTPSRWFEPLDAPGVVGQVTIDEEFLQG